MEETKNRLINKFSKIKSKYILKRIFQTICEEKKLEIIINNKYLQDKLGIDINYYKKAINKFMLGSRNGFGKEYILHFNNKIFEGNYLNGKKNGKGKEYDLKGNLIFEGIYFKGKKISGKGYDEEGTVLDVF